MTVASEGPIVNTAVAVRKMTVGMPDIIILLAGVPFAAMAVAAYSLGHEIRQRIRWEWLTAFATMIALYLWLQLVAIAVDGGIRWCSLENALLLLGFTSLFMFGLSQAEFRTWHRLPYIAIPLALVIAFLCPGNPLFQTLILILAGLPAAVTAAWALWIWSRGLDKGPGRVGKSLAMLLLALPLVALVLGASLSVDQPPQPNSRTVYAAYFLVGLLMAVTVFALDAATVRRLQGPTAMRTYKIYVTVLTILMLVVLTSGYLLSQHLARLRYIELMASSQHRDSSLAAAINSAHRDGEQVATALAASPSIVAALQGDESRRVLAEEIATRWARSFDGAAVLVLDSSGQHMTRGGPRSGSSDASEPFADRGFFKRALEGEANATATVDPLSGLRALLAAAPVVVNNKVLGVLVVKTELERLERTFPAGSNTMLVDPHGVIWMSSEPKWLHKHLWAGGMDEEARRQLGSAAPESTSITGLDHAPRAGDEVTLDSTTYAVSARMAGPPGWVLMSLSPLEEVMQHRATALLSTAAALVLLLTIAAAIRQRTEGLVAQQQQLSLAENMHEMERLMRVLSHDLRTPLAASQATVDYLLSSETLDGEAKELLANVGDEQTRMADMVTQMLDAIRIRRGAMEWSWGQVDVKRVLESARTTLMSLPGREPGVAVGLEIDRNIPTVYGDAAAIRRLVENLVSNALRFTKQGEVTIAADVVHDQAGSWLRISVTDTGEGIDKETLALLGKPFALSGKHKGSGSGLGIGICSGICAAHGGQLTVRSRPGEGSQFTAWLRTDLSSPQHHRGEPQVQILS